MKLTWPHVVVVGIIFTGVAVLAALGVDPQPILLLGGMILAGIGVVHLGEIKNAANGTQARILALMEHMATQLRDMPPLTPPANEEQAPPGT